MSATSNVSSTTTRLLLVNSWSDNVNSIASTTMNADTSERSKQCERNLRWFIALGMIISLATGTAGIILKRFYSQYAILDILAICGFMIFTSTAVSLMLTRVGYAFKRLVRRSRWAEVLGVITLRTRLSADEQILPFRTQALLPPGTVVCVVPPSPTLPLFCPDNSGDMLTIFEDYSQYPPQPRRLFDTHRLSPTTSPVQTEPPRLLASTATASQPDVIPRNAGGVVCLPGAEETVLYVVDSSGAFVPLAQLMGLRGTASCTSASVNHAENNFLVSFPQSTFDLSSVRDPPPSYASLVNRDEDEEPPPAYGEALRLQEPPASRRHTTPRSPVPEEVNNNQSSVDRETELTVDLTGT